MDIISRLWTTDKIWWCINCVKVSFEMSWEKVYLNRLFLQLHQIKEWNVFEAVNLVLVDYKPTKGYYILFYIGQCTSNGTCVCHCGNCTSGCDTCLPGWSGSTINHCQKCNIILKITQYINYILVYYTVCINNHGQYCITLHLSWCWLSEKLQTSFISSFR